LRRFAYVNDADPGIIKDETGWNLQTGRSHQADAFREKALADPEHHDRWIDEAIKWLERAMEASCRAAITVDTDHGLHVAEPSRAAIIETMAAHRRVIVRQ